MTIREWISDALSWTPADTAAETAKVKRGKTRLEGWAEWQKTGGVRLDTRGCTPHAAQMEPSPSLFEETREMIVASSDVEAMEVDKILAVWKLEHFRRWKLVHTEFLTGGSSEQKARRSGLNRTAYRKLIDRVQAQMAEELGDTA